MEQIKNSDFELIREASGLIGTGEFLKSYSMLTSKHLDIPEANFLRAICLIKMHRYQEALLSLEKELFLYPGHIDAKLLLEDLRLDLGYHNSSAKLVTSDSEQKIISNNPNLQKKINILLVYSLELGNITLPEWIKDTLRTDFKDQVQVFAVGPHNEIDISDGEDFYDKVAQVIEDLKIDILWDIEGGAKSKAFLFDRLPKNIKIPKVYWAIDTHQFLDAQIKKAAVFDHVFSAQKNAVNMFGPKSSWLPAGASHYEVDYKMPRTINVGFVGNIEPGAHDRRKRILSIVKQAFPDFVCVKDIFREDKAKLVSQMKIVVNVSLNNDLNFRVFETLSCGAMLITDKLATNGLEDLFVDGKELVTFTDENDLIKKIRYYLENEQERNNIAQAGQLKVLDNYKHKNIIETVLPVFRELIGEKKCWCGGELRKDVHPSYGLCNNCGTQVLSSKLSEQYLKDFYSTQGYWIERQTAVFNFPDIEGRAVNDFKDRIPVWYELVRRYKSNCNSILEIGCAHGGFLRYCLDNGVTTAVGIEVDSDTCNFAKKRFNLEHVISGLYPDVELPFNQYDCITGFDVFEHFTDPVRAVTAVKDSLKSSGICIFQTPCYRGEGGVWGQFKQEEHTFLYTKESIKKLFTQVGLEVVDVINGFFPDDMFIIAKKSEPVIEQIKKIAFIRTDAIGDNILASAMLEPISKTYIGAEISVICREEVRELYEACPFVTEIISYDPHRVVKDGDYLLPIVEKIQNIKADMAINSSYSREGLGDHFVTLTDASKRYALAGDLSNDVIELRTKHNQQYTDLISSKGGVTHELERSQDLLNGLGVSFDKLEPKVYFTADDIAFADNFFSQYGLNPSKTVGFYPCSQWQIKDYNNFAEAIAEWCIKNEIVLIGFGGLKDKDKVQKILERVNVRSCNLSGVTTLRQSGALLKKMRMSVGADTGTAHMSLAVGIPTVVVMGGGQFGRFFPWSDRISVVCRPLSCFGCNWRCTQEYNKCVADIDPALINEAVQDLWNNGYAQRIYCDTKGNVSENFYKDLQTKFPKAKIIKK